MSMYVATFLGMDTTMWSGIIQGVCTLGAVPLILLLQRVKWFQVQFERERTISAVPEEAAADEAVPLATDPDVVRTERNVYRITPRRRMTLDQLRRYAQEAGLNVADPDQEEGGKSRLRK